MRVAGDGPASSNFKPLALKGNASLSKLAARGASEKMTAAAVHAPIGSCVSYGIPFQVGRVLVLRDKPIVVPLAGLKAQWLVFMHTTDEPEMGRNASGVITPMRGPGGLRERVADYVLIYGDGHRLRRLGRQGQLASAALAHAPKGAPAAPPRHGL
jgi:hypothetical protein